MDISPESLELAESLIAKKSAKLDMDKFEYGYEIAVKELVNAKVNHLAIPHDEVTRPMRGNVVNLMDALRKSTGDAAGTEKACCKCEGRIEERYRISQSSEISGKAKDCLVREQLTMPQSPCILMTLLFHLLHTLHDLRPGGFLCLPP